MKISSVEEYGLRCLVALARIGTKGQMSISQVADMEGLSIPYAAKLLSILRRAGLVTAVRGRRGGFCITRHPHEVTLFEVITALGGPLIAPNHCARFTGQLGRCVHTNNCSVHEVLDGLADYMGELLSGTTLQDLINSEKAGIGKRKGSHSLTTALLSNKMERQTGNGRKPKMASIKR
jgi:Rrf2 family iron-sulfur cluster assembly transcriptional regulator